MIAEEILALAIATFLLGFVIGDMSRRAVEAEKARRRRRAVRHVERSLRQIQQPSSRTPW